MPAIRPLPVSDTSLLMLLVQAPTSKLVKVITGVGRGVEGLQDLGRQEHTFLRQTHVLRLA